MIWLWFLFLIGCMVAFVTYDTSRDPPLADRNDRRSGARALLLQYGIQPTSFTVARQWAVYIVAAGLVLGLLSLLGQPDTALKDKLSISGAVAAFVVAYTQWQLARYEASLEKYYDRLDIANRRLNTLVEQSWNNKGNDKEFDVHTNPPSVGVSLFDMWVFAELDNLEYVIEKYRRGYIEAEQASRGLSAFKGRCTADPEFFMSRAAEFCRSAVYHDVLRDVVAQIDGELRRQRPAVG